MRDALKLFEQLEIKYIPCSEIRCRGPMSTCCGKFVQRLIKKHGLPHATIVLRTIVESEGNQAELIADTIGAVSDLVRTHARWVNTGLAFIESFDQISLAQVRKTAKATGVQPLRDAIMTLLCVELEKILGPSKLPKAPKPVRPKPLPKRPMSEARIPQVKANIELGLELLTLRKKAKFNNCAFGRMVRAKGFDTKHASDVSAMMNVARIYSNCPEIFTRLSWGAIVALASPSLPPAVRQDLEARILAGESIGGPDIARARGGPVTRTGRPKRQPDQPARMAA